ncbi:MAG: pyruvate, phosphate dikinase, partial [Alphaproteobacteria bacterium]
GARASMPGMMDTVLNLGLNDRTVAALAKQSSNERFAWDSYRRFIQMYSDVVLGIDHYHFEELLEVHKEGKGRQLDTELSADDLRELVGKFKAKVLQEGDGDFPQDVNDQLWGAISAVFGSWQNARAITYRRLHDIPVSWGTAVNIQAMVFGNMGNDSATGVAFTRDPSTGEKRFFGEYLINAQGEDVVAGIRTPQHLTQAAREAANDDKPSLEEVMPEVFSELEAICQHLEAHYRDMQDIEFTVQNGSLYILQTRSGKRTAEAAIRIAVEMTNEGLLNREEAIWRVEPDSLEQLLHPTLDPNTERQVIAHGLPASPGAATGKVAFSADQAEYLASRGEGSLLVRMETSPEDIHGMHASRGILTARGGMTSHAAVVARGMGRPCVSGARQLLIDYQSQTVRVGGTVIAAGDVLTIDGSSGEVMLGEVATIQPKLSGDFGTLMSWADEIRQLGIRTNAETPTEAQTAIDFGAEGIGLCRTEHMFFETDRILAVREMILAKDTEGRRTALARILPMQREDFVNLFKIMSGFPVTIRLLDPPLHEFLPKSDDELAQLSATTGTSLEELRHRANQLHEYNPMLGHRGCRLGISHPEIYEMQARAIFEAAVIVGAEQGKTVVPEVMIPLIAGKAEFTFLQTLIAAIADEVAKERGVELEYLIGTMIELPRAALRAGEIAEEAQFFSFGTNDLTQTVYGISRDDSVSFLADYRAKGIIEADPFTTLDRDGVGELIKLASQRGLATRPDLKLGICGEHGGDPASIAFCHSIGLNYVSCSPFRVPIARLAAAQAAAGKEKSVA